MGSSCSSSKKSRKSDIRIQPSAKSKKSDFAFRVIVVGAEDTGKTSIIHRLSHDYFSDKYLPTVGCDFKKVSLNTPSGTAEFQLMDTAGQEKYRSLSSMYFRDVDAALLCYSIDSMNSFKELDYWIQTLRNFLDQCIIFLIGNKSDLELERMITFQEGEDFQKNNSIHQFFEVSAKTGLGIKESFEELGNALFKSSESECDSESSLNSISLIEKPVIYLYSPTELEVNVSIKCSGFFSAVYPPFHSGSEWKCKVDSTGISIDDRKYKYLFWEAKSQFKEDFSTGFVVSSNNCVQFLEEKLSYLGLNDDESNDFITYWIPQFMKNGTSLVSFQFDNYNDAFPLKISPPPSKMLRLFMAMKKCRNYEKVEEQKLTAFTRSPDEFTVVEWGGMNVK